MTTAKYTNLFSFLISFLLLPPRRPRITLLPPSTFARAFEIIAIRLCVYDKRDRWGSVPRWGCSACKFSCGASAVASNFSLRLIASFFSPWFALPACDYDPNSDGQRFHAHDSLHLLAAVEVLCWNWVWFIAWVMLRLVTYECKRRKSDKGSSGGGACESLWKAGLHFLFEKDRSLIFH